MCFSLAEVLHRPVHQVMDWPVETIIEWVAYFELKDRRRKD